jgi:uncharacterized membrane protein YeaQ/YmgE (transglycosylase-associated protein family)
MYQALLMFTRSTQFRVFPHIIILIPTLKFIVARNTTTRAQMIMKGEYEMGLLSWIIVGLIAGWLANQMMRGGRGNAVTDIVVGIIGALVGGFLAGELFGVPNAVNGINVGSIVVAFLGAVVAIAIVRALPGRSPL